MKNIASAYQAIPAAYRRPYTASIKTRIPRWAKKSMQRIADEEGLNLADICRRALRFYVAKCTTRGAH